MVLAAFEIIAAGEIADVKAAAVQVCPDQVRQILVLAGISVESIAQVAVSRIEAVCD